MVNIENYLPENTPINDDVKSLLWRESDEETIARCNLLSKCIVADRKHQEEYGGYCDSEQDSKNPFDKVRAKYKGKGSKRSGKAVAKNPFDEVRAKYKGKGSSRSGKTSLSDLVGEYTL